MVVRGSGNAAEGHEKPVKEDNMALAMFQNAEGKTSGTSVSKVVIVLVVMLVFAVASLRGNCVYDLPESVVWLIGVALGLGVANKGIDLAKK